MAQVRLDSPLRKEDLLSIESVLYEAKQEELVHRRIARVNTNYDPNAAEIGYDWYKAQGSAKILAAGASANDVPFVNELSGRETRQVYDIVEGIKYTKAERRRVQAKQSIGKGPAVQLDLLRVNSARRLINELEAKIFFVGDDKHGIKGMLNHPGIIVEDVAVGATGANDAAKRLWANKTPKEKLKDLLQAKKMVERGDLFQAKVLVLTSDAYNSLLEPYSDMSPMTVLSWLMKEGAFFEEIIKTSALNSTNSKLKISSAAVAGFAVLDNRPEIIELATPEDMTLSPPVYDILESSEQVATIRTAGCVIRHPTAVYIGRGI